MVDIATLKRGCVGAKIQVRDKVFQILNVMEEGGRHFLLVDCEGKRDKVDLEESKAIGLDRAYERLFIQPSAQQQRQRRVAKTRQIGGVLNKIKPELPYIHSGYEMIGRSMSGDSKITIDNISKVHVNILELERYIQTNRLGKFVRDIKLKEGDAPPINRYVSRCATKNMNIMELIEWEKKINGALNFIWSRYPRRIKELIKPLMQSKDDYRKRLDKEGFKDWKAAESIYVKLRTLEPKKLKEVCEVSGRSNKQILDNADKKIRHWQAEDSAWMHYWNCLAATVEFINYKLIPRINRAIAQRGQTSRGQRRRNVTVDATGGEPAEVEE